MICIRVFRFYDNNKGSKYWLSVMSLGLRLSVWASEGLGSLWFCIFDCLPFLLLTFSLLFIMMPFVILFLVLVSVLVPLLLWLSLVSYGSCTFLLPVPHQLLRCVLAAQILSCVNIILASPCSFHAIVLHFPHAVCSAFVFQCSSKKLGSNSNSCFISRVSWVSRVLTLPATQRSP